MNHIQKKTKKKNPKEKKKQLTAGGQQGRTHTTTLHQVPLNNSSSKKTLLLFFFIKDQFLRWAIQLRNKSYGHTGCCGELCSVPCAHWRSGGNWKMSNCSNEAIIYWMLHGSFPYFLILFSYFLIFVAESLIRCIFLLCLTNCLAYVVLYLRHVNNRK